MNLINNSEERLLHLETGLKELDFPSNIIIELGSRCNIRCVYCANHKMKRPHGRMSEALYKKIIDEIADAGQFDTRVWLCGYGEPLLAGKEELCERIAYAKAKGLRNIFLNTNGTLLNDAYADAIIRSGLDWVVVSMDAFSKELYELQKPGADRDVVYQNIVNLNSKAREQGSSLIIEVQFVLQETNLSELDAFLDFWKRQKVRIKVREMISWNRGVNNKTSLIKAERRIACAWGLTTFPIIWSGEAVNCGVDMEAKNIWGNVAHESIRTIWDRKKPG